MKKISTLIATLLVLTEARIAKDGLWTPYDYYQNDTKLGVQNGVIYTNDTET